jgi:cytochrome c-type biogenesis protein CcmH
VSEFWIVAGFMTVIALAFVAWPVWRHRESTGHWSLGGIIALVLVAPAAVYLYRDVTTWAGEGGTPSEIREQLAIVEQLAQRMQSTPDDVEGWRLLGRSYLQLQQYPLARQALMQAWQRTPMPDNALKLNLGIAMVLTDRASFTAEGGRLIEEVLISEPENPEALFYGGLVAYERGRSDITRQRWQSLIDRDPNSEFSAELKRQLALVGETSLGGRASSGTTAEAGPSIRLHIRVADGVSTEHLGPNARLFIFARDRAGGPPLAVVSHSPSMLPGDFTLSDDNVMLQGRSLADVEEVTLVARLSASGQASEQIGDLYAERVHRIDDDTVVDLTIDQEVE